MYKAIVNKNSFEVVTDNGSLLVDGKPFDWNTVKISDGYFHIIVNNKSYRAEVVRSDEVAKAFSFKINGKIYSVELKDKFDLLLEKMGINNSQAGKINVIKAPMPGLIIDLRVKENDTVNPGDPLLILEAMKMENVIKAPGEGVVKSVKVKKGDNVEKNQVLIEF